MIRSFGDKQTAALFRDERVRQFEGIARRAKRKLEAVNAASRLDEFDDTAVESIGEAQGRPEGISLDSDQRSVATDL
jgi:plasmid maintenance system killer protein